MNLTSNIDIVQITIRNGVEEYYLPNNVNWRDRTIDKILLCLAPNGTEVLSPIDGQTPLLTENDIKNLYFDIYSSDDTQIARNLSFENLLSTNNNPLQIGQQLSLKLSRLFFSSAPTNEGCILFYVFYGEHNVDEQPVTKSITVNVQLGANRSISLEAIVDNYIYMQPEKVRGIYVWDAVQNPVYITLRDKDGKRTLNSLLSTLCRPPMQGNDATDTQAYSLWLNNINIDMLNSFVQNGTNRETKQKITFLY